MKVDQGIIGVAEAHDQCVLFGARPVDVLDAITYGVAARSAGEPVGVILVQRLELAPQVSVFVIARHRVRPDLGDAEQALVRVAMLRELPQLLADVEQRPITVSVRVGRDRPEHAATPAAAGWVERATCWSMTGSPADDHVLARAA